MRSMSAAQGDRARSDGSRRARRAGRRRRGQSLIEVQVAFALLALGLAGICRLAVMQIRQVRKLEQRLQGQVVQTTSSGGTVTMLTANTYYLVPWQNPWTRKLAGSAQIVAGSATNPSNPTIPCDPGPLSPPSGNPPQAYPVNVIELDAPAGGTSVTAYVDVSAP